VASRGPQKETLISAMKKEIPPHAFFEEELEPVEVAMVPDDQLTLTAAELDEEFTKTLTSLNPNQPLKTTHFNFKSGHFESVSNDQHVAEHLRQDGIIWSLKEKDMMQKRKDEEQQQQQQTEQKDQEEVEEKQAEEEEEQEEQPNTETVEAADAPPDGTEQKEEENVSSASKKEILVKNQFNFSDRASQTFNEPYRDRQVQTEPAPKSVFSANASASTIRDEYLVKLLRVKQQQSEEENKKKKTSFGAGTGDQDDDEQSAEKVNVSSEAANSADAVLHSKAMLKALKIMERVTVLNANAQSYNEFKYYEVSDYKRGSFLSPLWTFKYLENAPRMVTCLEWNKLHLDLFAVGYGSYNFNMQTSGMICVYSLKSTVYPEKIILCESGVMCMSFHPKFSSLLCVGFYDGSVAVYDVRNMDDSPIYSSQNPQSYHYDPVWGIQWHFSALQPNELTFYSISSDSNMKLWKMTQNELSDEVVITLRTPCTVTFDADAADSARDAPKTVMANDDIFVSPAQTDDCDNQLQALCSCFDFNPLMEHIYLVGTEDGHILQCSRTYNDGFTNIRANAHFMNIYALKWNPFHSKIFLSCSEDWTVKLWEEKNDTEQPAQSQRENASKSDAQQFANNIITYDLGNSVNDIAWSPFSSTIFAAVTSDGKVFVFDLAQNKNAPLCREQITKKNKNVKLTKVSFPIGMPLIIVGDEKGNVYALKLSPNLYLDKNKHRDLLKNVTPQMFENEAFQQKEKQRLVNVLDVTGNKVFDVIQHLSPKPKKINKSKTVISS